MKRILFTSVLIFLAFAMPIFAQTATVTAIIYEENQNSLIVTCAWVADGAGAVSFDIDANVDGLDLTRKLLGRTCVEAVTIPDQITPPAANYDVTVLDGDVLSIFGAALLDRSATLTESTVPVFVTPVGNVYGGRVVRSTVGAAFRTYSITITNAGAGGAGTLRLIFK